jgi:hypothetical protein
MPRGPPPDSTLASARQPLRHAHADNRSGIRVNATIRADLTSFYMTIEPELNRARIAEDRRLISVVANYDDAALKRQRCQECLNLKNSPIRPTIADKPELVFPF